MIINYRIVSINEISKIEFYGEHGFSVVAATDGKLVMQKSATTKDDITYVYPDKDTQTPLHYPNLKSYE